MVRDGKKTGLPLPYKEIQKNMLHQAESKNVYESSVYKFKFVKKVPVLIFYTVLQNRLLLTGKKKKSEDIAFHLFTYLCFFFQKL